MSKKIQRLLPPTTAGEKSFGEAAIWLPEELAVPLRKIFSFDVGGANELEGDKIFWAMKDFYKRLRSNAMCVVAFWVEEDELGKNDARFIYALTPIEKAAETIEFIEDQLSERPLIETINLTGMRQALLTNADEDDVIATAPTGWFDLDSSTWIFKNLAPLALLSRLFGKDYSYIPQLDRVMDFRPPLGGTVDQARRLMGVLANAWGRSVTATLNWKTVTVAPAPTVA